MDHLTIVMKTCGWLLVAGSVLLAFAPAQFVLKGKSPLGDNGVTHYFLAFSASLNLVWGMLLLVAARDPAWAVQATLPCAIGFATLSAWRIPLCRNPDVVATLGKAPMAEVWIFALLAVYFLYSCLQI